MASLFLRLDGKKKKKEPCQLSRRTASNLQACPIWPQGPPAVQCHDGQLQQFINYAEAINALGKLSAVLRHPPALYFSAYQCSNIPAPILI